MSEHGAEIGSTRSVPGTNRPEWNEQLYAVYDNSCPIITVNLMQHPDTGKATPFRVGSITTETVKSGLSYHFEVQMENSVLNLECELLSEHELVLKTAVDHICEETTTRVIKYFVEHVNLFNPAFV
jgi:hypothetical protein